MDSFSENICLQARIRDLERENANLREANAELVKEKDTIFYKLTKEEFWKIWKTTFETRFDSSNLFDDMMILLRDLVTEYPHIVHTSNK
jgi:hypothetical protein